MFNISTNISVVIVIISILIGCFIIHQQNKSGLSIMAQTGLLMVSNVTRAQNILRNASKHVSKTLYISVNSSVDTNLPAFNKQIVNIYSKATSVCGDLDVRLLMKSYNDFNKISTSNPIDLILYDSSLTKDVEIVMQKKVTSLQPGYRVMQLDFSDGTTEEPHPNKTVKKYNYVALGGTFDRLHNGHKILISEAVLRTVKELTVGVTDVNMIQSKKLWELIEPLEKRINSLKDFLTDINPDIDYNIVPIQDIYGPTKEDGKIQLLVVSEETIRGGKILNDKRAENGLPPMDIYSIDLAQDVVLSPEEEAKVSSSNRRMRLLGTLIKPPVPNPNIPDRPYVLGLSGGIASGKTQIAERLRSKGAAIINCDTLGHELYLPGLPLNGTIAETFGKDILTDSGEVDRKKLGQIVFSNKTELHKLNEIMWPAILEEAERRVKEMGRAGCEVVVLEAAVMVQARWHRHCHQLWAVIVPPQEAVKRLIERNGLSEEAAKDRISAQPSNSEQVAEANIVFSPYWSYEYTQGQVDKAWDELMAYLKTSK